MRQGLDLLTAAEWYFQHGGGRLSVVVLSDKLAAQFGEQCSSSSSAGGGGGGSTPQARSGWSPGEAPQAQPQSAVGMESSQPGDDDAELEALLRQMDVRLGSSSSSATGSGGASRSAMLEGLLEGLSLGGPAAAGRPAVGAAADPCGGPISAGSSVLEPGVHILSASQYFSGTVGAAHPPAVQDIYDSIAQSLAEQQEAAAAKGSAGGGGAGQPPHLSAAAIEAGLQAASLLQGKLSVSRRNAQEATGE